MERPKLRTQVENLVSGDRGEVTRSWGHKVEVTDSEGKKHVWGVNRFWREYREWAEPMQPNADGLEFLDLLPCTGKPHKL